MNDRERLIELIAATKYCPSSETDEFYICNECPYGKEDNCREAYIADHLIAHGVTVQKHGQWVNAICQECAFDLRELTDGENDLEQWVWDEGFPYCPNCGAKMDGGE